MPFSNIDKGSKYFNTVTYTGDGTNNRTITGVGFQPDFVWIKSRSLTTWNATSDVIRGANKTLFTNATDSEYTNTAFGYTSAFTSDGFTLTTGSSGFDNVNNNGATYTSWNWKANGTGVSNTSGTITSTVSANTTSGFSIVSYTGNGNASATFGHGLGATPKLVIIKNRPDAQSWQVWFNNNIRLGLNSTASNYGNFPISTSSTLITTPSTVDDGWNGNTKTYIAYCFADVKGFSKFGSYTGNGSTDGTFVYTGFKPKFFLAKRTDTTNSWTITNSSNQSYNQADTFLLADSSQAESTATSVDYLSNGVKIRSIGAWGNASGGTYIYMAFAENPFVSSKGIPCTAR